MAHRMLALTYEYVPDILERREPHRDAHLARINEWIEAGTIVMAGALGDPPHGALFAFDCEDPRKVEEYIEGDPYVRAGLVPKHTIEPWTVVAERG